MWKFCDDEIIKRKQETNLAILFLPYLKKVNLWRPEFQWTDDVSQQWSKCFFEIVIGKQNILPSGSCPPPAPFLTAAQCLLLLVATCFPSNPPHAKHIRFRTVIIHLETAKQLSKPPLIVLYSNSTVCHFCCLEGWWLLGKLKKKLLPNNSVFSFIPECGIIFLVVWLGKKIYTKLKKYSNVFIIQYYDGN